MHGCSAHGGGVPQTETHSPELCNSLLKQSHPGTLSSLHPAGSPASAPDPSEPPVRAPARYNIKKEDGTRAPGREGLGVAAAAAAVATTAVAAMVVARGWAYAENGGGRGGGAGG